MHYCLLSLASVAVARAAPVAVVGAGDVVSEEPHLDVVVPVAVDDGAVGVV